MKGNFSNKQIIAVDKKTLEITVFHNQFIASRLGFNTSKIGACCKENEFSHKGYYWFYSEKYNQENLNRIILESNKPRRKAGVCLDKKECTKCNEIKDLNEFGASKRGFGRRHSHCKKCRLKYVKNRYDNNEIVKLKKNLRKRLNAALKTKKWQKNSKFRDYIGCDLETLKKHIESKFQPGMTWENYSLFGWHIDHIIPLSSAKTEQELYKLCHYTNLQPLWREQNLRKGGG